MSQSNRRGSSRALFKSSKNSQSDVGTPGANNSLEVEEHVEVLAEVFHAGNSAEDITMVRNQGLDVDIDCDTGPAPENISSEEATINIERGWGWNGTCNRATIAAQNHRQSIVGIQWGNLGCNVYDWDAANMSTSKLPRTRYLQINKQ